MATIQPLRRSGRLVPSFSRVGLRLQEELDPEVIPRLVIESLTALGFFPLLALAAEPESGTPALLTIQQGFISPAILEAVKGRLAVPAEGFRIRASDIPILTQAFTGREPLLLPLTRGRAAILPGTAGAILREALRTLGATHQLAAPLRSRGESLGIVVVFGQRLRAGDQRAIGLLAEQAGIALENTRIHEEEIARTSRLRTLINGASEALLAFDPMSTAILDCNQAAERLLGSPRTALAGLPLSDLLSTLLGERLGPASLPEDPAGTVKARLRRKDGQFIDVELRWWQQQSGTETLGFLAARPLTPASEPATVAVELDNDLLRHTNEQLQSLRLASEQQAGSLAALAGLSRLILLGSSAEVVLEDCAQRLLQGGAADAVVTGLIDAETASLRFAVVRARGRSAAVWSGLEGKTIPLHEAPLSVQLRGQRLPLVVAPDSTSLSMGMRARLHEGGYRQLVVLPLSSGGEALGAVFLIRHEAKSTASEDLSVLQMFADHVALALRNAQGVAALAQMREDAIFRLAAACEARDPETGQHLRNIRHYVRHLCRAMNFGVEEIHELSLAAVLHDVGKIRTPESILLKPGPLLPEEYEVVKLHTIEGAEILAGPSFYETARQIARHHHERWDGSGYPDRQQAADIPFAARITAVADVFDALTSRRVYKPAWSVEQAGEEILRVSGSHFDPGVVEAFRSLWIRGDFNTTPQNTGAADARD